MSVGWAIIKGSLKAPEASDDESSDEESTFDITERTSARVNDNNDVSNASGIVESVEPRNQDGSSQMPVAKYRKRRTLRYHLSYLFFGFLAICLAGYVLSHAATSITDEFGVSDVLFGVVILSIATTLPEKFVAVMSGHRGHAGILVANTAGSNIFLLALCSGIVMLDTSGKLGHGNVTIPELGVLWGSTFAFTATVWLGGRFHRCIGAGMLMAYIAFIVLEFTVIHPVDGSH